MTKFFLILDWIDDKVLRHRFYSVCCFIAMHLLDKPNTYTYQPVSCLTIVVKND